MIPKLPLSNELSDRGYNRAVTEPGELFREEIADWVVDRLIHFAAATSKAASKP